MPGFPRSDGEGSPIAGLRPSSSESETVALLLDDDPERRERLATLFAGGLASGSRLVARPLQLVGSSAGGLAGILGPLERRGVRTEDSVAALVAMSTPEEDGPRPEALATTRRIADRGVPILAYADGASAWALSTRCRVLLAGARHLADSAVTDFAAEARGRLASLLGALHARRAEVRELGQTMAGAGLLGGGRAMLDVFRAIARASRLSDVPALILGETGTGKELVARALHRLDNKRGRGPFVPVNCAALPKSLAESELFGHRRGAFSGAERTRRGLVRAADGGVLFLDEIGELDVELQAKLLRVLQEGRVLVVGEDEEVPVSVRVVAATHRDLEAMVERGEFREDLWHRLSAVHLRVPPLRERREDIALLTEHLVRKHAALAGAVVAPAIGADFVGALGSVDLRGNVRQLENVIRGAMAGRTDAAPLGLADLPPEILREISASSEPRAVAPPPETVEGRDWPQSSARLLDANGWNLARALESCERMLLTEAIACHRGNQTRMAQVLGITPRSVYNKLRRHHLKLD
jgi:DNA-binding NtrC family response regulator